MGIYPVYYNFRNEEKVEQKITSLHYTVFLHFSVSHFYRIFVGAPPPTHTQNILRESIMNDRIVVKKNMLMSHDGTRLIGAARTVRKCIIPRTVKIIDVCAFRNCTLLKEIHIPSSVEIIKKRAFIGCTNLLKVHIDLEKSELTHIQSGAFDKCKRLESIVLPHRLETIGKSAFSRCTNLKDIYIRPTVKSIEKRAFHECINLPPKYSCTHKELLVLWIFGIEGKLNRNLGYRVYQRICMFLPMHEHQNLFHCNNRTASPKPRCVIG